MAWARVSQAYINQKFAPVVLDKIKDRVKKVAQKEVEWANAELVRKYMKSAITKELLAGPKATNRSGTLGKGNLYSFLGLESSSDVEALATLLSESIKISLISKNNRDFSVSVRIRIPEKKDYEGLGTLPWVNKNFIDAIEEGISGLGNYLYSKKGFSGSRSGTAIQVEKSVSQQAMGPNQYLSQMIEEVSEKLMERISKKM